VAQAQLRLIEVRRQAERAAEGAQQVETVDARARRELGEREIVREMRREIVARRRDRSRACAAGRAGRRRLAVTAGKLDQGGDQQRLAREPCFRLLEGTMQRREPIGEQPDQLTTACGKNGVAARLPVASASAAVSTTPST
jgi:hypothetical protein